MTRLSTILAAITSKEKRAVLIQKYNASQDKERFLSLVENKLNLAPVSSSAAIPKSRNKEYTRDYRELEATHVYDNGLKGSCPKCGHVDKFTICPECYFSRGQFIPTNLIENNNQQGVWDFNLKTDMAETVILPSFTKKDRKSTF